jgi:hypothetical protein
MKLPFIEMLKKTRTQETLREQDKNTIIPRAEISKIFSNIAHENVLARGNPNFRVGHLK